MLNWRALLFKVVILPLARMPFKLRYRVSDFMAWLLRSVIKYRQKVIDGNLAIAFPEKSEAERVTIRNEFYRHFTDLALEQTWLLAASEEDLYAHCKCVNPEIFERFERENKPVLICAGHHANYELAAISLGKLIPQDVAAIYAPLANPYFNDRIKQTRERFGLQLWARGAPTSAKMKEYAESGKSFGVCFGFDQSPHGGASKYWYPFFDHMSAHARGVEVYSRKYDAAVVFGWVSNQRRGFTEFTIEVITENAREVADGVILQSLSKKLEKVIRNDPSRWMWSHRRWKLDKARHFKEGDTELEPLAESAVLGDK